MELAAVLAQVWHRVRTGVRAIQVPLHAQGRAPYMPRSQEQALEPIPSASHSHTDRVHHGGLRQLEACLLVPRRFAAVMFTTIAVRTGHNTQRTGLMSKCAVLIFLVA
jgi:hypothetical protein